MAPFTLRWGIMATGGIAQTFAKDLLADPAARGVDDVRHEVVAAASSTSQARAAAFLAEVGADVATARAYGSYAALVADAGVDIVYVATPHSHHFQNAMLALRAGRKHVLCEKALTVTAAQARALVAEARAQADAKRFFMEAVWTRFFPLSAQVRDLVRAGAVGTVYRVLADNALGLTDGDAAGAGLALDDGHRLAAPALAGGALLDLGIYALTWVFQILYHLPEDKEAPQVVAALSPYGRTGVDESTAVVVQFPRHGTQGVATTSLRVATGVGAAQAASAAPAILVQGSAGEIQIQGPAYKPLRYRVVKKTAAGGGGEGEDAEPEPPVPWIDVPIPRDGRPGAAWPGHGMFWEADEAARCIRDGRTESAVLPLDESLAIMDVMDAALRQGGIVFPPLITTDVYDPESPLNTGKASA